LIRTVWKGRWIVLGSWVVITGVGAVIVHSLPTIYTAQALVLVDSQKIPERFVSSTVSTELQDRIASISQQILSSSQLNTIINDFGLYRKERATMVQEEIIEKMRKDIDIKVDKTAGFAKNKPGSFRVAYQGPNPSVVAQVANRLTQLFINENLKTREVQAEGTSEFIESQLQEAKKSLDALEASVSEYKLKHNGELPQQENVLGSTLARLQGELNSTRDAISRGNDTKLVQESTLTTAEATLQALQEQASAPTVSPYALVPPMPGRVPADPAAAVRTPAMRRSDTLRAQLETARVRWKDDHPDVKRLKADLEQAEELERAQDAAALAAAKAATAAKPVETVAQTAAPVVPVPPANLRDTPQMMQLRERIQLLQTEIELTKRDIEKRKISEQRLLVSIADVQARIDKLPLREQEMAVLMRDYSISKDNYQKLLANKLSAGMSKDMELRQKSERFTVLDPAMVPERPSKPDRPKLTAGISAFGMFLGIAIAFLLELRRDVLLGDWELPAEITVLGTLPRLSGYSAAGGSHSGKGRPFFRKRALISSAVLGALAVAAVGLYLVRNRF
jgi:polysaccharide chain length determinant protein (PEP-CTERM system associated)